MARGETRRVDERPTRPRARAAVVPLRGGAVPRIELDRLVPSTRSILTGIALLVGGIAAFALARQTSMFAIRTIEVQGAPPALERQVRAALAPLVGQSLVALDGDAVGARLARLREVRGVTYDRAFPNTLRIVVRPNPPVAVLRSGRHAWFVSAHGAVLRPLARPFPRRWPRVWVARAEAPSGRAPAVPDRVTMALRALGDARRARSALRPAVRSVRAEAGEVTFVLRSGLQLRLGRANDVALKLAVAARLLRALAKHERATIRYLDVTVPSRPVAGRNPQL
ncbi:MAG: FtsQ-type POTRA domain-containing protein [Thermoleophilia bacterium]|nr:FtsQ-type POTRA domain-containing protein [Thermoleophilia bacterium]